MSNNKPKVIVVVGVTATGKSALGVALARRFGGEIISADSRQIYRGLNIGTGKVTKNETRGVPHHLIDIATPKKRFSVAEYQILARKAIEHILAKKKLPVICGGTGLYACAIVDGTTFPEVPPNNRLRRTLEKLSTEKLYERLQKTDPKRARTIDRKNPRRLVRAIEIATALGKVPEAAGDARFTPLFIGISAPKEVLRARIHRRLLERVRLGMIAEAQKLHKSGLTWKRMEELGLEYRYLSRYLRGILDKEEMLRQLELEIVRYAKRQLIWWKRDPRIHWIAPGAKNAAVRIVKKFLNTKKRRL